jgi:uncharacterized protein (DUF1330 family)
MNRTITVGLSMLAGATIGGAVVETLHAQAKPPGFTVAEIIVKDKDGYMKEFAPAITKTIQDAGGKFLVRGGRTASTLGAPPSGRVVITQYESFEKAQEWANSQAVQDAEKIGQKYADIRNFVVEGVAP